MANGEGRCTIPVHPERLADSPTDAWAGRCQPGPVRVGSRRDSSEESPLEPIHGSHNPRCDFISGIRYAQEGDPEKILPTLAWNTNELRPLFIFAKKEFSDNPIGAVIPAAIDHEATPKSVSPIAVQSRVTADRFLSPIALISADENRLGPQASPQRFRCSDKGFLSMSQGDYLELLD